MLSDAVRVCPRCHSGSGQPFRTVPDEATGSVRVLMRCDACHHRWSVMVPRDTLSPGFHARLLGQALWPPA
jgi:predicted CxxxxCH...CXXCH cytochrome family protein